MQIGKPIRTVVVEPLESPVPAAEPEEVQPVEPKSDPEPEPQHKPVKR